MLEGTIPAAVFWADSVQRLADIPFPSSTAHSVFCFLVTALLAFLSLLSYNSFGVLLGVNEDSGMDDAVT